MARKGRTFELLIEHIEKVISHSDQIEIESPYFLPDKDTKSERKREFDVAIINHAHHQEMITCIECKDLKIKVGSPIVESFVTKVQATGVNLGVIVSKRGFSKPALEKAERYKIKCLTLEEALSFNWLSNDFSFFQLSKNIIDCNLVVIPESECKISDILNYIIIDDEQREITSLELMNRCALAVDKYDKTTLDPLNPKLGNHIINIKFENTGLFLKNKFSQEECPVKSIVAKITYATINNKLKPNLLNLSCG